MTEWSVNQIYVIIRRIKMDVLKISTKSNPNSVAGAIAGLIKERGKAEMQVIGSGDKSDSNC